MKVHSFSVIVLKMIVFLSLVMSSAMAYHLTGPAKALAWNFWERLPYSEEYRTSCPSGIMMSSWQLWQKDYEEFWASGIECQMIQDNGTLEGAIIPQIHFRERLSGKLRKASTVENLLPVGVVAYYNMPDMEGRKKITDVQLIVNSAERILRKEKYSGYGNRATGDQGYRGIKIPCPAGYVLTGTSVVANRRLHRHHEVTGVRVHCLKLQP